jgi:anti-anti-sigma regulatory factor
MEVMRKHSIRHLPVVDEEKFIGFLTEGDLRQASLLSMVDKISIEDGMIKNPVSISPEVTVRADADRLRQVLSNLIDNAIKYNNESGWIGVDAAPEGKIILIHIDGPRSFGSAKDMVRRLEGVAGWSSFRVVVLDLSDVPAIDSTAALAVEDMIRMAQAHHQHLVLVGMQPVVTKVLDSLGVLQLLQADHHHARRLDALRQAAQLAESTLEQQHPAPAAR